MTSFTIVIDGATFDTNLLIYYIDSRDQHKHHIAKLLVDRYATTGCSLSVQVLNEFFRASTRRGYLDSVTAAKIVHDMRRVMLVQPITEADLVDGLTLHQGAQLQFYDSVLIATVARAGCTTLFSEDMQHGRSYLGVTVVNPFRLTQSELLPVLS